MTQGEKFLKKHGPQLDLIAEANDQLGTLQGVAMTSNRNPEISELSNLSQKATLVFEHGIMDVGIVEERELILLSLRAITRIDGT